MIRNRWDGLGILFLCGLLASCGPADSEDRPADQILADIKAIELPPRPPNPNDQAMIRAFAAKQRKAMEARAELIGELFRSRPDQPELAALLPQRWQALRANPSWNSTLAREVDSVLAKTKDEKLIGEASYYKLIAATQSDSGLAKPRELLADFDAFAKKHPSDPRIAGLLYAIAGQVKETGVKVETLLRVQNDYPNSIAARQSTAALAKLDGERRKLERIGKPFELEFTDATRGTQVSMAGLKGKVVVVDFWATWCGPCVAEMPNMKGLYARYKDQGVEFIGVSLDHPKEKGGLDRLKAFVAANGIEWPQYYQGNYWMSEFSSSWDVQAIPCVFLVDADGNLASIDARGRLETLIPEYLEKAKAKAGAAKAVSSR